MSRIVLAYCCLSVQLGCAAHPVRPPPTRPCTGAPPVAARLEAVPWGGALYDLAWARADAPASSAPLGPMLPAVTESGWRPLAVTPVEVRADDRAELAVVLTKTSDALRPGGAPEHSWLGLLGCSPGRGWELLAGPSPLVRQKSVTRVVAASLLPLPDHSPLTALRLHSVADEGQFNEEAWEDELLLGRGPHGPDEYPAFASREPFDMAYVAIGIGRRYDFAPEQGQSELFAPTGWFPFGTEWAFVAFRRETWPAEPTEPTDAVTDEKEPGADDDESGEHGPGGPALVPMPPQLRVGVFATVGTERLGSAVGLGWQRPQPWLFLGRGPLPAVCEKSTVRCAAIAQTAVPHTWDPDYDWVLGAFASVEEARRAVASSDTALDGDWLLSTPGDVFYAGHLRSDDLELPPLPTGPDGKPPRLFVPLRPREVPQPAR